MKIKPKFSIKLILLDAIKKNQKKNWIKLSVIKNRLILLEFKVCSLYTFYIQP